MTVAVPMVVAVEVFGAVTVAVTVAVAETVAVAVIRGRGRARGSRSGGAGLKQATRDEGRADRTTLRPSPPPHPQFLRGQVVSLFDPAIAPVGY